MGVRFGAAVVTAMVAGGAISAGAALARGRMQELPCTPSARAIGARHQNFKQLDGAGAFDGVKAQVRETAAASKDSHDKFRMSDED